MTFWEGLTVPFRLAGVIAEKIMGFSDWMGLLGVWVSIVLVLIGVLCTVWLGARLMFWWDDRGEGER